MQVNTSRPAPDLTAAPLAPTLLEFSIPNREAAMGRVVPAVARALDVLELFLDGEESLSTPEIVARLDLPRTTGHELVSTLASRSYLSPAPGAPGRFRLGVRAFQLGSAYASRLDLAREGRAAAEQVAAACDETVHLAILDGTEVIYVAKVDSTHAVRMVSAVGRRLPAHCTAVGKMLLSGLPDAELDARLPPGRPLQAMTPNSVTSVARMRRMLSEIRARGLATESCESNPDVACVAAPVYDHTGAMVAAMSISVPTSRWTAEREERWGRLVRDGAATLSTQLGHRPRP
jgi:IclR family KDG regulon transcriptional repressor